MKLRQIEWREVLYLSLQSKLKTFDTISYSREPYPSIGSALLRLLLIQWLPAASLSRNLDKTYVLYEEGQRPSLCPSSEFKLLHTKLHRNKHPNIICNYNRSSERSDFDVLISQKYKGQLEVSPKVVFLNPSIFSCTQILEDA